MRLFARATCASVALALVSATAALAQQLPSDADTPSDSPSAWNDIWPWLLLGVGVFVLLLLVAVGMNRQRRRTAPAPDPEPAAAPSPPPPAPSAHASTSDIAVLTYPHIIGAERAYANVRDDLATQPWLAEVVFVECHRHDRIVVRGTFAGRYVDVDGPRADLVRLSDVHGGLLDEIRADVPEGSSALVIYAPTDDVDALAEAFRESGGRLTRHRVSDETAAALAASVAQAPPSA
jgi:hypothetical protein